MNEIWVWLVISSVRDNVGPLVLDITIVWLSPNFEEILSGMLELPGI